MQIMVVFDEAQTGWFSLFPTTMLFALNQKIKFIWFYCYLTDVFSNDEDEDLQEHTECGDTISTSEISLSVPTENQQTEHVDSGARRPSQLSVQSYTSGSDSDTSPPLSPDVNAKHASAAFRSKQLDEQDCSILSLMKANGESHATTETVK